MKVCSHLDLNRNEKFSILVPSNLDKLQHRLQDDKTALTVIWKRIQNNRLPAIPRSVLTVNNPILSFIDHQFFSRIISMCYWIIMNQSILMRMFSIN